MTVAMAFAQIGMAPFCLHFKTMGPNTGSDRILLWRDGELFEKQNAERIMKGVVGRTGKKRPTSPTSKETAPPRKNKYFAFQKNTGLTLSNPQSNLQIKELIGLGQITGAKIVSRKE